VKNCTADIHPLITKSRRDYYSYTVGDQRPPVGTGKNLGLSLEGPDPCVPSPRLTAGGRSPSTQVGFGTQDGVNLGTVVRVEPASGCSSDGVEPGHTPRPRVRPKGAHAVEFSKTVAPLGEGLSSSGARPRFRCRIPGRTDEYRHAEGERSMAAPRLPHALAGPSLDSGAKVRKRGRSARHETTWTVTPRARARTAAGPSESPCRRSPPRAGPARPGRASSHRA
jgi:hypothetical protein